MNSATARKQPEQNSPFCWALLAMVNVREETNPLVSSPREEQRSTGAHPSPGTAIQPAVQQKHGQAHRKEKNARNHSVKKWLNTLSQIHHLWKDKGKTLAQDSSETCYQPNKTCLPSSPIRPPCTCPLKPIQQLLPLRLWFSCSAGADLPPYSFSWMRFRATFCPH